MFSIGRTLVVIVLLSMLGACAPVAASTTFAQGLSDATGPLIVAGIAATAFGLGDHAKARAARVADAAIIAFGTAELLEPNLQVSDNGRVHSFPSGHTAIAFAAATSLADVNPKQKWLYYAGAALVGWSRVETDEHSWGDILAGAALGFGAGRWSMSSADGLLIGRVYRF